MKSSCFPSFWFSGKGFDGCGKEFDGSGKLWLWEELRRVSECCKLKVAVSRGFREGPGTLFPIFWNQFTLKGSYHDRGCPFKVFQFFTV